MNLYGSKEEIMKAIAWSHPEVIGALERAREVVPGHNKDVYAYQAACLFALANKYNQPGKTILEIGTYYGYTAAVIAEAAPKAHVVTLNILEWEYKEAVEYLKNYANIEPLLMASWDYLKESAGTFDMIFIDGDHKRVTQDLPWWERVKPGGLMLLHDYAPGGTPRGCPPVYNAVNMFAAQLGRDPDVMIVDDTGVGMAGFVKEGGQ